MAALPLVVVLCVLVMVARISRTVVGAWFVAVFGFAAHAGAVFVVCPRQQFTQADWPDLLRFFI